MYIINKNDVILSKTGTSHTNTHHIFSLIFVNFAEWCRMKVKGGLLRMWKDK